MGFSFLLNCLRKGQFFIAYNVDQGKQTFFDKIFLTISTIIFPENINICLLPVINL
jgi:hypothetical protein